MLDGLYQEEEKVQGKLLLHLAQTAASRKKLKDRLVEEPSSSTAETSQARKTSSESFSVVTRSQKARANSQPKEDVFQNFIFKIENQLEKINKEGVPEKIKKFINLSDLKNIYHFILDKQDLLRTQLGNKLTSPLRLKKEEHELPRTINLLMDVSGEIILTLETKRKLASRKKDVNIPIFSGTSKHGKPTWRIDCFPPCEWMNMVVSASSRKKIQKETAEAELSQALAANVKPIATSQGVPLNVSLIGASYRKRVNGKKRTLWCQSLYSPRATLGTLQDLLSKKIKLSDTEKRHFAYTLLSAIKIIHDKNYVHQDLKPANILVYQDRNGGYDFKVNDYGLSVSLPSSDDDALATLGYESPEISLAYEGKASSQHAYFSDQGTYSYGREISPLLKKQDRNRALTVTMIKNYGKPHKSNDMWAAGILIYQIFSGKEKLTSQEVADYMARFPLIKGLLAPKRNERLNVDQALAVLEKMQLEEGKEEVETLSVLRKRTQKIK